MSDLELLFAVVLQAAALSAVMTTAWAVQQRTGNSGWIDAFWTFGLGSVGAVSALAPFGPSGSISERQILVAALIAVWSVRLGFHIVQRSAGKSDDPRYAELIAGWGADARREMFLLVQKQAIVSLPLALAIFVAAHNPAPVLRLQDWLGVLVVLISIAGETTADRQLRSFSANNRGRGAVCNAGLWRYSRHPNYFFEWLHWLAYPIIAIDFAGGYPWGWLALAAPATMYWLLAYVSGVPPLEEHMLRKHGNAYRDYQKSTNAFFPGAPLHG